MSTPKIQDTHNDGTRHQEIEAAEATCIEAARLPIAPSIQGGRYIIAASEDGTRAIGIDASPSISPSQQACIEAR